MTPLFTLTTPNGKHKLIGFEHTYDKETLIERTDWLRGQGYDNWKAFDLSDMTDDMAKEWGYEDMKWCKIAIWNESRDEGMNEVSNILLIVIEE